MTVFGTNIGRGRKRASDIVCFRFKIEPYKEGTFRVDEVNARPNVESHDSFAKEYEGLLIGKKMFGYINYKTGAGDISTSYGIEGYHKFVASYTDLEGKRREVVLKKILLSHKEIV